LPNRTIALSGWTEFGGHGATSVAEAVLRLLARPAHFSEIVQEAAKLYGEAGIPGKGTIHNALNFRRDKFVWVKSGTLRPDCMGF